MKTINMQKTILDHAKEILYDRKEEKERQYGPFKESIKNAAAVATVLAGRNISTKDVYAVQVGIKIARQGYAHKSDNVLDAIVYLAQMNDEEDEYETLKKEYKNTFPGFEFPTDFTSKKDYDKVMADHEKSVAGIALKAAGIDPKTLKAIPGWTKSEFNQSKRQFQPDIKSKKTKTYHGRTKKVPTTVKNDRKKTSVDNRRKTRKSTKR